MERVADDLDVEMNYATSATSKKQERSTIVTRYRSYRSDRSASVVTQAFGEFPPKRCPKHCTTLNKRASRRVC
jgi:hypothetical protein